MLFFRLTTESIWFNLLIRDQIIVHGLGDQSWLLLLPCSCWSSVIRLIYLYCYYRTVKIGAMHIDRRLICVTVIRQYCTNFHTTAVPSPRTIAQASAHTTNSPPPPAATTLLPSSHHGPTSGTRRQCLERQGKAEPPTPVTANWRARCVHNVFSRMGNSSLETTKAGEAWRGPGRLRQRLWRSVVHVGGGVLRRPWRIEAGWFNFSGPRYSSWRERRGLRPCATNRLRRHIDDATRHMQPIDSRRQGKQAAVDWRWGPVDGSRRRADPNTAS